MAPTPLPVKYYAPDEQSDDWDQNDQQNGHHNLLPEVFSQYAPPASLGMSVVSILCTVKIPEMGPYGWFPALAYAREEHIRFPRRRAPPSKPGPLRAADQTVGRTGYTVKVTLMA